MKNHAHRGRRNPARAAARPDDNRSESADQRLLAISHARSGLAFCTYSVLASWASHAKLNSDDIVIEVRWTFAEDPHRVGEIDMKVEWPSLPSVRQSAAQRVADMCAIHATLAHPPKIEHDGNCVVAPEAVPASHDGPSRSFHGQGSGGRKCPHGVTRPAIHRRLRRILQRVQEARRMLVRSGTGTASSRYFRRRLRGSARAFRGFLRGVSRISAVHRSQHRDTWQGAAALEHIIDALPKGRLITWIFSIPFVRPLAERFYRWFAMNRYHLGCGEHCQLGSRSRIQGLIDGQRCG